MTTERQIKDEIARQTARYYFLSDPQVRRILAASIKDLRAMLKAYPAGLVWAAAPPER